MRHGQHNAVPSSPDPVAEWGDWWGGQRGHCGGGPTENPSHPKLVTIFQCSYCKPRLKSELQDRMMPCCSLLGIIFIMIIIIIIIIIGSKSVLVECDIHATYH